MTQQMTNGMFTICQPLQMLKSKVLQIGFRKIGQHV